MKILYIYLVISMILYIIGFILAATEEGSDMQKTLSDLSAGKYEIKSAVIMIIAGIFIGIVSSVPQFIYGIILYLKEEKP